MRPVAFTKGEALSRGQHRNKGMAHRAEMTEIPSSAEPSALSAAAERMRRHRQRRRDGLRCFIIELRETEIDTLITNGLLAAESRHNYESVQSALYAFLDRALGELGDA
jgi:hypothetical protein